VYRDEPGRTVGLPNHVFFRDANFKMFEHFISSGIDRGIKDRRTS